MQGLQCFVLCSGDQEQFRIVGQLAQVHTFTDRHQSKHARLAIPIACKLCLSFCSKDCTLHLCTLPESHISEALLNHVRNAVCQIC